MAGCQARRAKAHQNWPPTCLCKCKITKQYASRCPVNLALLLVISGAVAPSQKYFPASGAQALNSLSALACYKARADGLLVKRLREFQLAYVPLVRWMSADVCEGAGRKRLAGIVINHVSGCGIKRRPIVPAQSAVAAHLDAYLTTMENQLGLHVTRSEEAI